MRRLKVVPGRARQPASCSAAARASPRPCLSNNSSRRFERGGTLVDSGVRVADLLEAARHGGEGEVARLRVRDLLPGKRRRHGGGLGRSHRVRRGDGAVLRILVVVDEDAVALFLPPLAARDGRRAAHFARERRAARRTSSKLQRFSMRTYTCRPRLPDVLASPPGQVIKVGEHLCNLADLRPFDAGHRIEVDAQLVGMLEVLGAHRMRVQLEAGEVRHPARAAASRGTTSSAARPDGKRSSTTSIQAGRACGARFW